MGLKHISKGNLAKKQLGPGLALPWGPDCLKFMLAGHAVTTLVRKADGKRHTYYIRRAVDEVEQVQDDGTKKKVEVEKNRWFVHLLAGADNQRAYKYLGCIDDVHGTRRFRTTKGTSKCHQANADNINLIGDTIKWLVDGASAGHKIEVWQRGICGRCCAELTVPSSIKTGLGPTCAGIMGITMKKAEVSTIEKLAALAPVEGTDCPIAPELASPDPVAEAIDALVSAADLTESARDVLTAVVTGLRAASKRKLSDLRTKKTTEEEAA
jgi:hypothetical protein